MTEYSSPMGRFLQANGRLPMIGETAAARPDLVSNKGYELLMHAIRYYDSHLADPEMSLQRRAAYTLKLARCFYTARRKFSRMTEHTPYEDKFFRVFWRGLPEITTALDSRSREKILRVALGEMTSAQKALIRKKTKS